MRINKFVAQATGLSRRAADQAIADGRVLINGQTASPGDDVASGASVRLDNKALRPTTSLTTLMLNKPVGYVCSRRGQGSSTIYDLLPTSYHQLKPVGRLDKDSSGLLLLTNDGQLANRLTHPRYGKTKQYSVTLNKPLDAANQTKIELGIQLEDGLSQLILQLTGTDRRAWIITMSEGRNRQIRRTFAALGHSVTSLHRTQFGSYKLGELPPGKFQVI